MHTLAGHSVTGKSKSLSDLGTLASRGSVLPGPNWPAPCPRGLYGMRDFVQFVVGKRNLAGPDPSIDLRGRPCADNRPAHAWPAQGPRHRNGGNRRAVTFGNRPQRI